VQVFRRRPSEHGARSRTCPGRITPALPGAFHSLDHLVGGGEEIVNATSAQEIDVAFGSFGQQKTGAVFSRRGGWYDGSAARYVSTRVICEGPARGVVF
jgi:hypothetical protein